MEMIYSIMHYVPSFIECYIFWRLLCTVLETKYQKVVPVLASAGLFLLIQSKQIFVNIPVLAPYVSMVSLIMLGYTLLIFVLFTKNTFVEKLIWWSVYSLGLMVFELISLLILGIFIKHPLEFMEHDNLMSLSVIIICKVITLLIYEIIIRKRHNQLIIKISYFRELTIIIILNLLLILIMVTTLNNRKNLINSIDDIIIIFMGVVLLITAYTMGLIFRIEKKSNEELATQLKLQQIEMELKLNIDMVTITDKLRKLRHDMNNHIGLMKTLAKAEKYDELKEYIDQIYEDVEAANDLVLTENKTLSILLNAKKSLAKEKNIDFVSIINTPKINMQSKDICSLLCNILDNALESAEKCSHNKYIQLMIQKTEEGCVINCENSIGLKPILKRGKFITNKEDSLIHGIGTENIKDIVKKYNGELTFEYNEEYFNVHVILPV